MSVDRLFRVIVMRCRSLVRRRAVERDLDDELAYHIDRQIAHHIGRGVSADEARRLALRAMGGVELRKEQVRDVRGTRWLEEVAQDVRGGLRLLRRSPGFSAVVVLTLALGIGANAAVFSMVDAVLLHPLAVYRPEELVAISQALTDRIPNGGVSYPLYRDVAERSRSLSGIAAFQQMQTVVKSARMNEQVETGLASGTYFSLLGLTAQAGRLLTPADDDAPGAHAVVVLSDALWTRVFNRDTSVIGSVIRIGGTPFTVIGVAPRGFHGTVLSSAPQLWVPATMLADIGVGGYFAPERRALLFSRYQDHFWHLIGRVRPHRLAAVAVELNTVLRDEERAHPVPKPSALGYAGRDIDSNAMRVTPLVQATTLGDRESLIRFLDLLMAVVGLTLLIACLNVANLLVVRAGERTGELSLRAALGASRGRIARQLLMESVVLAVAGGIAGAVLDRTAVGALSAFVLPGDIALANIALTPNVRVLAFTALLGLVTAAVFGLLPSVRASRADLIGRLRTPATAGRGIRAWLIGAQVGLSLTLLVGAALFVQTMRAALTADIGFDPRPLAAITVNPSLAADDPANARGYDGRVLDAAAAIPGVTGAALSTHLPLGQLDDVRPFVAEPNVPNESEVTAGFNAVSDGYFDVLGDPLIDGRPFGATDDAQAPPVAIVNETAAHLFAPNGRPLGRVIVHANMMRFTIVGVVRDTKYESVRDEHVPMVFVPIAQQGGGDVNVIVRSANPKAALAALGRVLRSLPPNPPQRDARLVADQVGAMLMPQRFGTTLLGLFSLVALAISAVGIYGGVSYAVNRQRREIGIRIALGARVADVVHLVATRVAMVVACGIVAGLAGAALTSRALDRFLYGVTPLDPAAFLAATLVMSAAAAVAFAIPLARAIRIDPTKAIRTD